MSCLSHLINLEKIKNVHYINGHIDHILVEHPYEKDSYIFYLVTGYVYKKFEISMEEFKILQEMFKDPVNHICAEDLEKIR